MRGVSVQSRQEGRSQARCLPQDNGQRTASRPQHPLQAVSAGLNSLSAALNSSPKVLVQLQRRASLNSAPRWAAPMQAKSQKSPGLVAQLAPIGEVGDEPAIVLDTYEKVMKYIATDKTIDFNFLDHRADAEDIVNKFVNIDHGTYEFPSELLHHMEAFARNMERDEPEEDAYDEPRLSERVRHKKNKTKNQKKGSALLRTAPSKDDVLRDKYALMTGDETTNGLNSIEGIHIDIFSNLYQGGKESDFRHHPGGSDLKKLNNAAKFLANEKKDTNYKTQLEMATNRILNGSELVRKMSRAESSAYRVSRGKAEDVFRKGSEGMKAFRIDATYSFKSAERDARVEDYEVVMLINLTAKLKTYFINFLSANVSNPLGVQDKSMHFGANPQFKFEGDDVTILIPPSGWGAFWSFVANDVSFKDNKSSGK